MSRVRDAFEAALPVALARADARGHRSRRRAATLLALLPLTIAFAVSAAHFVDDNLIRIYGAIVLAWIIAVFYLAFVRYDDPSDDPSITGAYQPFVSCLVAVRDDVDVIEDCVRSLLDSTWPHLEVIVVDDASTDGTTGVLRMLAARAPIRLFRMRENVGKKRALTEAVRRARGDLLMFTDSDCVLAPDAIERCVRAFEANPDLGAVSGHARALNRNANVLTRIQDSWYDGQFGVVKAAESVFGAVPCVSGPLAVFRREAIVNYFPAWADDRFVGREFRFATDRQLTAYVLVQRSIGRKLKQQYASDPLVSDVDYPERRWRIGYVRSARVWTNVPETLGALVRQQVRWKKSFVRSLCFVGRHYYRLGVVPAALFYTHVLLELLAPVMAYRYLVWLPLHGLAALTLLYLVGVFLKGCVWAVVYRVQNRDDGWKFRPGMSLLSATMLSWLLPYSLITLRRNIWSRGQFVRSDGPPRVCWIAPDGKEWPTDRMPRVRWHARPMPIEWHVGQDASSRPAPRVRVPAC
jgi:cellulose synthase/poly-beta-1,6-N-acetylglucosamine synthase-like glycosyltransferase